MLDIDVSGKNGKITFNDFVFDDRQSLGLCLDDLKEDMLQIEFPGDLILDVGWRPSFDIRGGFHILLIKNYDWEKPIYHGFARTAETLNAKISEALLLI
ncbi:hypothetical protein P5705_09990 [Pseudomonas entomophila]|uniref:hypothetical protein n=1 Tax=Pseudomonas entomophila TaxID=312306 RepID=UPI002406E4E5|nr:hypothetical protein [Pseudomonas entomophila]MDF9617972.1 hypothetical protein [Pseudomonas entomophila]